MQFAIQHIHAKPSQRSRGILGVAFALALACALGSVPAYAEVLPEGSGSFDVSVLTDVLPTADPDAVFGKATVQTVDQAGAVLGDVQVEVSVVPPNNNGQPFGSAVSGSTGSDGRVVLQQVAAKGTYQVVASKQGYQPITCTFACRGASAEVWEVRLEAEPHDNPANSGGAGNTGNTDNTGNAKKLDTFGNLSSTDGASSAAGVGPSAPADAKPGDSAAQASSSQTLQTDSIFAGSGWVLAAVLLAAAAAVAVVVLVLFARKKKQGDQQ